MSEEEGKHFCVRNATPKRREMWRNIALGAWIVGLVPSFVAVVTLTGTMLMFAILIILNIVFIILNCGFCCVNLQTLKQKRIFYFICLVFMLVITAVVIVAMVTTPEDVFQIVGFAGCGLIFMSSIAFLILIILLHTHGPLDPVSSDTNLAPEMSQDLPSGILSINYVSATRGRLQDESIFRVQAGQVLSRPRSGVVSNVTESAQSTENTRRPSIFRFRTREESAPERERRQSIERLPIQIISDSVFNSQRRDSAISQISLNSQSRDSAISQISLYAQRRDSAISQISLYSQRRDSANSLISLPRRISAASIEYDTASVRCTCYYLPNETTDSDDAPPYIETPMGNMMTVCPLHGENPIPPPSYDNSTSTYNSLCRVLGLPEYDEVVITKPVMLSSMLKDVTESSSSETIPTASTPPMTRRTADSPTRTLPLSDRFSTVQAIFETIFEDRSERSDSFLSENTLLESDTAARLPPAPSSSDTVNTTRAVAAVLSATTPSSSAAVTTTATDTEESSPTASLSSDTVNKTTRAVAAVLSATTSSSSAAVTTTTTTEAGAADDGSAAAITTTAAAFTDQTTFSTSKQTA